MTAVRWSFISALETLLAGITPGGGFNYDLSGPGTVSVGIDGIDQRPGSVERDVQVQIQEGPEIHEILEIAPDTKREATFEVDISCLLKGENVDKQWRQRVAELYEDIALRVGANPTVSSTVSRARVARVDEPTYDPQDGHAHLVIRLEVRYFYDAGSSA